MGKKFARRLQLGAIVIRCQHVGFCIAYQDVIMKLKAKIRERLDEASKNIC